MRVTALVTCAGSMPAIAIINALKRQDEIPVRVVAVDMNPLSAGFHLSDASSVVPATSEEEYLPRVLEVCRREGVDIVFPVIDEEQLGFAEHRSTFGEHGIRIIVNDPAAIRIARDKYMTHQWCRKHDVLAPAAFLPGQVPESWLGHFPLIVKPRSGQATRGVFKVGNRRELDFFVGYVPNAMVQEFIDGQEYTVDVLTNLRGEVISVVPKARIETKAGMQVKGRTVRDPRLMDYGKVLSETLGLAPRCNIQCIVANQRTYLIEINPKFPASLPFTVAAGVNSPLLLVKMHLGDEVPPMIGRFRDGLMMLRYWQEIFVEPHPAPAAPA
jgi:carbamoyl-phosphate synthase large subunit